MNQGKPCPRAQAGLQVLYDPDRIQSPLRRVGERGAGQWEAISWEASLAEVSDRLTALRNEGTTEGLFFLHDAPLGQMRDLILLFCQAYGTPNALVGDGWEAERLTHYLTQGWFDLAAYEWEKTAYALFFGGSFLEDWQPQVHLLRAYSYMRQGRPGRRARQVQISPRFSVSAAKADEWVPIVPGRQGALALGMAHVIIRERLYDADFVSAHTEGFEAFQALVLEEYTPERVAGLTGLRVDTIERLAREFGGTQPAVAVIGRGLNEGTNTLFTHVAIHSLNALVGNIGAPGGLLRPRQPPFGRDTFFDPQPEGALPGARTVESLPERVESDPSLAPEILFLYEINPLFTGAGANRWQSLFQSVPFIVSFSSFMDESTLHADLVLPNHTFLERWEEGSPPGGLGRPVVALGPPVVAPLYDTAHAGDVLLDLARRIGGGMERKLPWEDVEEMIRARARGLYEDGGSIRADSFSGFWSRFLEQGVWFGAPYAAGAWEDLLTTPSSRFQFRMDQLAGVEGLEGNAAPGETFLLPHYEPPHYAGDPSDYPFYLVPYTLIAYAGARAPNAPLLWELYGLHLKEMWHNWVEIHPETAHALGIEDGEQVWVESTEGRIRLKARIYEGAMPDVVSIPIGGGHTAGGRWAAQVGGGNVMDIIAPQLDPVSHTVAWGGTRVNVTKEVTDEQ
jgi:anaerobic selenocysteine-containing dehydrogenase